MQEILTREAIQRLYDEGKIEEALKQIDLAITATDEPEEMKALFALEAWCHYRRKEYDECRSAIQYAGNNVKARECLAQLAAYVDKDDNLLMQIAAEFPSNMGVRNALVIRARDKDSVISRSEVMSSVAEALLSQEISATNVINNAGRFFHAKENLHYTALFTALGLLEMAFVRYGEGRKNLHHRAAVLFWQSKIMEELGNREAARRTAQGSLYLWERQVNLDPTNPVFLKSLEGAVARIAELNG